MGAKDLNNILLIGPAGSGKSYKAKKMAEGCRTLFISLNENLSYDRLVEGIQVTIKNDSLVYNLKKQRILLFIEEAINSDENYCLILDDINRVNLSACLGELLYAFRARGKRISLKSGTQVTVPDNIKLVATFNSSDIQSIAGRIPFELFDRTDYINNSLAGYKKTLDSINNSSACIVSEAQYKELCNWLVQEYDKYISQYCVFTREYKDWAKNFKLGMAYFLPSSNVPVNRWYECIQHKIRHQVRPLLFKYAEDGIIKKEPIPDESVNDTQFQLDDTSSEKISIMEFPEYDRYAAEFEENNVLPIRKRSESNASHYVNWQYLVLFVLVKDMIEHSLINQSDLMDLLTNDTEVFTFRNDVPRPNSSISGGCLFAEETLAPSFAVRDRARGNTRGGYAYSANYYKFTYKDTKYLMFSAWQIIDITEGRGRNAVKYKCPYNPRDCIETDRGLQKRYLYKTIKMLVYKYLEKYRENLEKMLLTDPYNSECQRRLNLLADDINLVRQMTDDRRHEYMPYYVELTESSDAVNIVSFIRRLETWKEMKNNDCGVFRIMSKQYKEIMDITDVRQMILQGPPGTSKTYGAKRFLAEMIGCDQVPEWEDELEKHQLRTEDDQYIKPDKAHKEYKNVFWDLLQFHPSYTYEDFVRGITVRPVSKKQYDGKIVGVGKQSYNTYHPNGNHNNGIEQYAITLEGGSGVAYKSINKAMGKIAKLAYEDYYYNFKDNPSECPDYYLVIDEINRANLATVFGELIYALEYRGEKGRIKTPYEIEGEDETLVLPPNLYIIGTMNTADRSIGAIDYAIRRRFLFFKLLPDINVVTGSILKCMPNAELHTATEVKLFYAIEKLFEICLNQIDYEQEDVQLGHTYFLRKSTDIYEEQIKYRFIYQIIPILFEYKKDGVLDFSRISAMDDSDGWKPILMGLKKMIDPEDLEELYKEHGCSDKDELYEVLYNKMKEELKKPENSIENEIQIKLTKLKDSGI